MATSDLLGEFREKAETRMKELEPLVEEHRALREFLGSMGGGNGSRPRKRVSTPTQRRGRKPGRQAEFVSLVQSRNGMTVREASQEMPGVNETYLHRIARKAVEEGEIRKDGSHYFPVLAHSSEQA